jgi:hypothetical protein
VAHVCNPSYSGGRDQEDQRLTSAQILHEPLSQKNPSRKKTGGVAQGVGHDIKPHYHKKKKKKKKTV